KQNVYARAAGASFARAAVAFEYGEGMSEAVRTEAGASRLSAIWSAWRDPAARIRNADWLAGLIAVMLPWSTTGVGIAAVLWLIALVPTIEPKALWQSLKRPVSA